MKNEKIFTKENVLLMIATFALLAFLDLAFFLNDKFNDDNEQEVIGD